MCWPGSHPLSCAIRSTTSTRPCAAQEAPDAPPFLRELAGKVARRFGLPPEDFPHVLVTEYPPGAPMGWHRDAPPFAKIYGISLGSNCSFRLRPHAVDLRSPGQTVRFTAERRSLYLMEGAARSAWQHGIPPVRERRWSITLRTLK
jgi:alkylated DNA repair dioxygenase AlkB